MKTNQFKNLAILLLLVGVFYTCTAEDIGDNFQAVNEELAEWERFDMQEWQHFDMQEWQLLYDDPHFIRDFAVEFRLKPQASSRSRDYSVAVDTEVRALTSRHNAILRPSFPGTRDPVLQQYYTLIVGRDYMSSEESRERGDNRARFEFVIEDFLATGKFDDYVREFGIVYWCANHTFPVRVNDPYFDMWGYGWPLWMIKAPYAWSITRGSSGVRIGVVDTEFRTTHEEFHQFGQNQFASVLGQSSANHHHGTAVASVAAARANNGVGIAGVAHGSRIAAHRVRHTIAANGDVSSYPDNISLAINNLHNAGVRIINVSAEATGLSQVQAERITREGTVLVLSAGNTPEARSHWYLADISGVIIVSSVDGNNRHGPTLRARNQRVTITAPGEGIRVAWGDSDSSYITEGGTSLAAPFVAGTVSLMRRVNPSLSPAQIESILRATADPIADAGAVSGNAPNQLRPGTGRLNAYAAVRLARTMFIAPSQTCGNATISILNMPSNTTINWTISRVVGGVVRSGQTTGSAIQVTLPNVGPHTIEGTMNVNGVTVSLVSRTWTNNAYTPGHRPNIVQYFDVAGQHAVVIPCGSDFTVPTFAVRWGPVGNLAGATIHWSGFGQQGYGLEFRPFVTRNDLENPSYFGIFVSLRHPCGQIGRADFPVRVIDGCTTGFSYSLDDPASDVLTVFMER